MEADRKCEDYTVGWVCALEEELTAALEMFDEEHEDLPVDANDDNLYSFGRIGGHNVVVVCLGSGQIGTNSAAAVATRMQASFPNLRFGLMVGIGGGVPSSTCDVRLGDVVVCQPTKLHGGVVQYDSGKKVEGGLRRTGFLNSPPVVLLRALPRVKSNFQRRRAQLQQHLQKTDLLDGFSRADAGDDILFQGEYRHKGSGDCSECDLSFAISRPARKISEPVIHYGTIASGNSVIKSASARDRISKALGDVLCFEMEAAGLMNTFPCLVIRGICDYADDHKNDNWHKYAAAVAAAYAKELLITIPSHDVLATSPIVKILSDVEASISKITEAVSIQATLAEEKTKARNKRMENKELVDISRWLSNDSYWAKQLDTLNLAQEGTGTWFTRHPTFQDWMGQGPPVLWCPGTAGAGKTVQASIVIDYLQHLQSASSNTVVAWIYCSYNGHESQSVEKLLSALLSQVVLHQDTVSEQVRGTYVYCMRRSCRPTIQDLSSLLETEIEQCGGKVYFVIDGLDECPTHSTREKLISILTALRVHIKLLVTSRPLGEISELFSAASCIEIRAQDEDVAAYIEKHITNRGRLQRQIKNEPTLKDVLIRKIIKSAQGMFLMAKLQIESIAKMDNPQDIEDALDRLPETYREIYDDAIQRIADLDSYEKKRAFDVLMWLSYCFAPLTIDGLRHALALKNMDLKFNARALPDPEDLMTVCGGLVIIDGESRIVRLAHYTTQEYLLSVRETICPNGHYHLAYGCLRYLSLSDFDSPTADWDSCNERIAEYSLLSYAANHWASHVTSSGSETRLRDQILELIERDCRFSAEQVTLRTRTDGYAGIWQLTPYRHPSRGWLRRESPLHFAAAHNLPLTIANLIQSNRYLPNSHNSFGETPLHRAADTGSDDAVDALMKHGAISEAPLELPACRIGRPIPLHLAANGSHIRCIAQLVRYGANVDARESQFDHTALALASATNTATVEYLLRNGADAKATCPDSPHYTEQGPFTYIHIAVLYYMGEERLERVKCLIEHGCDVNAQTGTGNTALHFSLTRDRVLTSFLLSQGASVSIKNYHQKSPFNIACERGKLSWLKDHPVPQLIEFLDPAPPIHLAVWEGDLEALTQHLAEGQCITATDETGQTALEYCVMSNNFSFLSAIIAKVEDKRTIAPILGGEVFERLVWAIADYEYREPKEWSAIARMLRILHEYRQLHNNDFAFAHARTSIGNYNKTLLIHAAELGRTGLAEYYLDCGSDVNAQDIFGDTAAMYAKQNVKILKLLVQSGYDMTLKKKNGADLVYEVFNYGSEASKAFLRQWLEA